MTPPIKTLEVRTRAAWRRWLARHHATEREVWLVYYKKHAGVDAIAYKESLEEALCYGWIDSLVRRLDDDRYVRKFTPRKPDSTWSPVNRKLYAELEARGALAAPGIARPPGRRSPPALRPTTAKTPAYIAAALKKNARAWKAFQALAPSHRRDYVSWIDAAKREDTKARRIREAIRRLARSEKLPMK